MKASFKKIVAITFCLTTLIIAINTGADKKGVLSGLFVTKANAINFCGDNLVWEYYSSTKTLTIGGVGAMDSYSENNAAPWKSYSNYISKVIINSGVTSIGSSAFSGCTKLTEISIPDSVINIGGSAFSGCTELESIAVDEGNNVYHSLDNCLIETESKTLVLGCKSSIIPDDGSVTNIGDGAFRNSNITTMSIPDSVKSIGRYAFSYCSGLTSITIPDSVTSIGECAFCWCSNLASVNIGIGATSIEAYLFADCPNIESIIVDTNNPVYHSSNNCLIETENKTLVLGCKGSIIPDDGSVTSIGYSAFRSSNINAITIPDSVTCIGDFAFSWCGNLVSVTIPDSVTSLEDGAFEGCESLTQIHIPDSVTSIGSWAFDNCTNLTEITIPNKVTTIKLHTFALCSNLTTVTIPDSVTKIVGGAFYNCKSLSSITIPDSVTSIDQDAFYKSGCKVIYGKANSYAEKFARENNINYICIEDSNNGYSVGDIIKFGSYPQTKVTDSDTLTVLNSLIFEDDWQSYGYYSGTGSVDDGQMIPSDYMRYADVIYNGNKYRAVLFDSHRPFATGYSLSEDNSYQDNNGYETGTVYWFKFEPIEWRVLDPASGLVMCNKAIDSQAYNNYFIYERNDRLYYGDSGKNHYASDYVNSSIRAWLNEDFYDTAFSNEEKNNIIVTPLSNKGFYSLTEETGYEYLDGADTIDSVFLLSYIDVTNIAYGFDKAKYTDVSARMISGTEYAKCQGLYEENGASDWWLRTPGAYSNCSCNVIINGQVYEGADVFYTQLGVIPALRLQDLLFSIDDATETDAPYQGPNIVSRSIDLPESSCIVRGDSLTWTVVTSSDVSWLKFVGTYPVDGGTEKKLTYLYKAEKYLADPTDTISVVDNEDGTYTWTIRVKYTYSVNMAKIAETWKMYYRTGTGTEYFCYDDTEGVEPVVITIGKTAQDLIDSASGYDKYTLVSASCEAGNETVARNARKNITIVTTDDCTKVRIGVNGKNATYQESSTNTTVTRENGLMIWVISYKFIQAGENTYSVSTRGPVWSEAKTFITMVG